MFNQEKVFPDSKAGVLDLLREESNINMPEDNNQVNVVPDPWVEGVWKVDIDPKINDGDNVAIVYLAGYADPWGIKRIVNDWELGNFIK
ncbi:MAG: hypothetical protein CMD08_01995 [Flavobacteriales bacterium]|nr:hypothetical protein [Flavobacteriales bacterium]|tara:strand:- start:367 stop:633 length:267 start_codon:yes stop_codon:yes gene_type:complete